MRIRAQGWLEDQRQDLEKQVVVHVLHVLFNLAYNERMHVTNAQACAHPD